jgi:hypothetical protein
MQNAPMSTRPDKPKDYSVPRTPTRLHDFSLEPLPVPDALESDSDTAWGLWENTLQAHDDQRVHEEEPPTFDDTVPCQLTELPPEDPKP